MCIAIAGYALMIALVCTLNVEYATGLAIFWDRAIYLLTMLLITFSICNYQNIWDHLPLHASSSRLLRLTGIALVCVLILSTGFFAMVIGAMLLS